MTTVYTTAGVPTLTFIVIAPETAETAVVPSSVIDAILLCRAMTVIAFTDSADVLPAAT
jgi:ribosomal protein L18E